MPAPILLSPTHGQFVAAGMGGGDASSGSQHPRVDSPQCGTTALLADSR